MRSSWVSCPNWVAAQGPRAGLDLFILIDDALDSNLGLHLKDLRNFINAQPAATNIAVGYTRNATIQIARDFTSDHAAAADALRMPIGTEGAYGSPYLSAIDLMKRWPDSPNRREIILITDGIDRTWRSHNDFSNPDVDLAMDVARRTGTMVHTIWYPSRGHWHRNFWLAMRGEYGLARLSEASGGEAFYLGPATPVAITQYLDRLQKVFDNQYLVTFSARTDKKAKLQNIDITTEIAGVDLSSADAVWVPAK